MKGVWWTFAIVLGESVVYLQLFQAWNDERFSFLTTLVDKLLSTKVVKNENLSLFHVHRSNWEISTLIFQALFT